MWNQTKRTLTQILVGLGFIALLMLAFSLILGFVVLILLSALLLFIFAPNETKKVFSTFSSKIDDWLKTFERIIKDAGNVVLTIFKAQTQGTEEKKETEKTEEPQGTSTEIETIKKE